jgi:hypothetical protein
VWPAADKRRQPLGEARAFFMDEEVRRSFGDIGLRVCAGDSLSAADHRTRAAFLVHPPLSSRMLVYRP